MLHKNLPEIMVGKLFFGQIAPSLYKIGLKKMKEVLHNEVS